MGSPLLTQLMWNGQLNDSVYYDRRKRKRSCCRLSIYWPGIGNWTRKILCLKNPNKRLIQSQHPKMFLKILKKKWNSIHMHHVNLIACLSYLTTHDRHDEAISFMHLLNWTLRGTIWNPRRYFRTDGVLSHLHLLLCHWHFKLSSLAPWEAAAEEEEMNTSDGRLRVPLTKRVQWWFCSGWPTNHHHCCCCTSSTIY